MGRKTKTPRTVITGAGYEIYTLDGMYFVDYYRGIAYGYSTLAGAIEAVRYQGFDCCGKED